MTGRENVIKHIDTLMDIVGDSDFPTLQDREALNALAELRELLKPQKEEEDDRQGESD